MRFGIPRRTTLIVPSKTIRAAIGRDVKALVWSMTDGKCWWCGIQTNPFDDFEVDHVVALALGGRDRIDNMVPSCSFCNRRKADLSVDAWKRKMSAVPESDRQRRWRTNRRDIVDKAMNGNSGR